MKLRNIVFLSSVLSLLFGGISYAETSLNMSLPESIKAKAELGLSGFYGTHFPLLNDSRRIVMDENNNILFDTQKDFQINIPYVRLLFDGKILPNINMRVSSALMSYDLFSEPLHNERSYQDYQNFRSGRFTLNNGLTPWQRFLLFEDLQVTVIDEPLSGGLIIGQQIIPFNNQDSLFISQPVSIHPRFTPITDYINLNILDSSDLPYQNSTMTHERDIGFTLYGNYPMFRFMTGLYNGSGPNTWDNNNAKDIFGKVIVPLDTYGEAGCSYRYGQDVVMRKFASINKLDSAKSQTGLQLRLGHPMFYLQGEYIWSQDRWSDSTAIDKTGYYISLAGNASPSTSLFARYDNFMDNNPLRKLDEDGGYYKIQELDFGIKQKIMDNLSIQSEYSYTWEDFTMADTSKQAAAQYGQFSVNANVTF